MGKLNKLKGKVIKSDPVISVDYNNYCYCYELQSENPIKKVMIRGNIDLISKQNLIF